LSCKSGASSFKRFMFITPELLIEYFLKFRPLNYSLYLIYWLCFMPNNCGLLVNKGKGVGTTNWNPSSLCHVMLHNSYSHSRAIMYQHVYSPLLLCLALGNFT
jgi:hypothetical protein